jgi:hypothetical protein
VEGATGKKLANEIDPDLLDDDDDDDDTK